MEYVDIEENAKHEEACRKVKQIAKAIEYIIKKNYTNLTKISAEDKKAYDDLNEEIEKIAGENGLGKLKTELISGMQNRYSKKVPSIDGQDKSPKDETELHQQVFDRFCGAKSAEQRALLEYHESQTPESMKKLYECQETARKFYAILEQYGQEYANNAIDYQRKIYAELIEKEKDKTDWPVFIKTMYQQGNVQDRQDAGTVIVVREQNKGEKEEITNDIGG